MTFTVFVGSGVHEPSLNYVTIDSGNWGPPQDSLGILPTILCVLFVYLCSLSSLLFPLNPQQVTVDDGLFLNLAD